MTKQAKKKITVYAGIIFDGREYEDAEILYLIGKPLGVYGKKKGWHYAGDQSFEESGIIVIDEVHKKEFYFEGKRALEDALACAQSI